MKKFWKTSEFWGVTLTTIGTVAAAIMGAVAPPVAAIAGAVSAGAYAIARSIVKRGQ